MLEAFQRADDVLVQAVRGISDLIINAGMINVDFADVKTIMSNTGRALMGTGFGKGERRAIDAAEMAISSPLLDDVSVDGRDRHPHQLHGGSRHQLKEINEAASLVQHAAHEDANIIFGVVTDPDMGDIVKVTVIATGFDENRATDAESMPRKSRNTMPLGMPAQTQTRSSYPSRAESPRESMARANGRRASEPQLHVSEARHSRAFGASALHDEAVLDIPAYLRRNSAAD